MDTRILNYFLIVAREENITKAAQSLHITQPTLSRQLMQLENELGVKLFRRGKHNIYLTEEGMLFRRRAQELVNLAERAKSELSQAGDQLTGEIAIGCNECQSMNELAAVISDFRREYPLVQFLIRSGNNNEVRERLEQGSIDFGLFVEPAEVEKFTYIRMRNKDLWGILVHQDSELASKKAIHSEDLVGVGLVTVLDETIHGELTNWSGKNADMMVPVVHYNLLSNAVALVRQKDGVAVCSKPTGQYEELTFVPFEPKLELGSLLAWQGRQKFSKASEAFLTFLKQDNILKEESANRK